MARPLSNAGAVPHVAVIGAGWAGLSAAVHLVDAGMKVTLLEMSRQLGGRARSLPGPQVHDNGQHILIGAYRDTLALMHRLGVDHDHVLWRGPLVLRYPDGNGLSLPRGRPWWAFGVGVLRADGWSLSDRWRLLGEALGWMARGFDADPGLSVADLTRRLPLRVRRDLIDPLCVAALNTPAEQASAQVWLRVLRDGLFGGKGSSDLLLPRCGLSELMPEPARRWLQAAGARVVCGCRANSLVRSGAGWSIDDQTFDAAVLACGATESARLAEAHAPAWASLARSLRYEPIVTVWLEAKAARLPWPMMALRSGPDAPGQFVFDHGQLSDKPGRLALVVSGAADWTRRGLGQTAHAARAQLAQAFASQPWSSQLDVLRTVADKRATFVCSPGLRRPPARIGERLLAAGDHVQGPYPATLESAVRSGLEAARTVAHELGVRL